MFIRLDRKKILTVSFFLCCFVPTLFPWFWVKDAAPLRGIQLSAPLFIPGAALYLYALYAKQRRHGVLLGALAHGVILLGHLIGFFTFSPEVHGLAARLDAAGAGFWVGLALLAAHLVLFVTTETAIRRLLEKRRPHPQP